jgi:transcriptional regulator with XRE-family HTH domain
VGGHGSGRRPDERRRFQAARLRSQGLTFAAIGQQLGITRQSAAALVKRAGYPPPAPPLRCASCAAIVLIPEAHFGRHFKGAVRCKRCADLKGVSFAVRLRSLRLIAGMRQSDLARLASLSDTTIVKQEAGIGRVKAETLECLSRVLGRRLAVGVVPRPGRNPVPPKETLCNSVVSVREKASRGHLKCCPELGLSGISRQAQC